MRHMAEETGTALQRAGQTVRTSLAFALYALRRFVADGCFAGSGALSYTTLVSLVPLVAIVTAGLSAFPLFDEARERFLGYVAQYFIPEVGEEAAYWLKYFASVAAQTTVVGIAALVVTSILLLVTIEEQLNAIWRVRAPRPWVQRVLIYWAVLTLGPLLLGLGLSLSTYLDSLAQRVGFNPATIEQETNAWLHSLAVVVPFLLETAACTLVYTLIPNCAVRWREGLSGAIVAGIAIEGLKLAIGLYISTFASYRTVYGALAAIPTFLLWMYVTWGAVLLGAVVAAALPQWRFDRGERGVGAEGRHLGLALALLAELADAARRGGTMTLIELASRLGVAASMTDIHLAPLQKARFVALTTSGCFVLARALDSATLFELYGAMNLPLAEAWRVGEAKAPWQRRVVGAMTRIVAAEQGAMQISLADLLGEPTTASPIDLLRRRG
jgi:membrane protein